MDGGVALPEDALIEILVHLPVKSLMRFRCVSKYWCALIKNPNFVSRHLKRDCNGSVLVKRVLPHTPEGTKRGRGREVLSFHDPDTLDLLVSPDLPVPQFLENLVGDVYYHYMGTCNGLVCLALRGTIVLCNPALREFELLPPSPFGCPEGYHTSSVVTGFGFDAITDSYKIVQLLLIVDPQKDYPEIYDNPWLRVDLYNSSTNSWRLIDSGVPRVMLINDSRCNLFFNGACHWHSVSNGDTFGILSLDLGTEVFGHFEFPHFEDQKLSTLGVVNQCLALVRYGGGAYDREFVHVWVMKEYGVKESWMKEFVIGPYPISYPILLSKNEWLLVVTMEGQLASCALHGNEIKRFHFHANDWYMRAVNFKESLVSLKQVILYGKKD